MLEVRQIIQSYNTILYNMHLKDKMLAIICDILKYYGLLYSACKEDEEQFYRFNFSYEPF